MQAQPLPIHRSFSRELVELSETSAPSDTCRMKAGLDRGLNDHQGCLLGMVPNKNCSVATEMVRPHIWIATEIVPTKLIEQLGVSKCCFIITSTWEKKKQNMAKSTAEIAFCVRRERAALTSADGVFCTANPTRHCCNLKFVGIHTIPPKIEMLLK